MSKEDETILDRWIARRDAEAFHAIVRRHSGMVYATCRRILGDPMAAEDVTQECFEALARKKRLPGAHLGPWLHRVATNISLKRVRADKRRRERERRFAAEHTAQARVEWNDIYEYVDEAIAELPQKLRIPVVAHFLESKRQIEIAAELGVSPQTVSYRINTGVTLIGKALKRRGVSLTTAALAAVLGTSLAEAAAIPTPLNAALGKLALAHAANAASGVAAHTATTTAALGGALFMKKVFLAVVVVLLAITAMWVVRQRPESVDKPKPAYLPEEETTLRLALAPEADGADEQGETVAPRRTPRDETKTWRQRFISTARFPRLERGRCVVYGTITGSEGRLAAGATVWVIRSWPPPDTKYGKRPRIQTVTAADGSYRVEQIPDGDYMVAAFADDAAGISHARDLRWRVEERRETRVDIEMRPFTNTTGSVRNADGYRIADASVMLIDTNWPEKIIEELLRVETDEEGRYSIPYFVSEACRIQASAHGYAPSYLDNVKGGTSGNDVTLYRGGSVSGTVRYRESGAPVAGAIVVPSSPTSSGSQKLTDGAGRYSFAGLTPNLAYSFDVEIDDYIVESPTVSLADGERASGVDIDLWQGFISGRVTDARGKPIGGAELGLYGEGALGLPDSKGLIMLALDGLSPLASAASDPSGGYRVTCGQCVREYYFAFIRAEGYHSAGVFLRLENREGAANIDFVLEREATVSGRVVDTMGRYVAGVDVSLGADATFAGLTVAAAPAHGNTDRQGRFRLTAVAPGTGRFRVTQPESGMQYRVAENEVIAVPCGKIMRDVEVVVVAAEECFIEGHVRDVRGNGIPDVDVRATCRYGPEKTTQTDGSGHYRLEGLSGEPHELRFQHHMYLEMGLKSIPVGATDADIVMIHGETGDISGIIVNAFSGEPIEEFEIVVAHLQGDIPDWPHVPQVPCGMGKMGTNPGEFMISSVFPGVATLEAWARGYAPERVSDIVVEAGKVTSGVTVHLSPTDSPSSLSREAEQALRDAVEERLIAVSGPRGTLEGYITQNGSPLGPDVHYLRGWASRDGTPGGIDDLIGLDKEQSGFYRASLQPGNHLVTIELYWAPAHANLSSAWAEITAGETTRLDFEMGGPCGIRGAIAATEEYEIAKVFVRGASSVGPVPFENNARFRQEVLAEVEVRPKPSDTCYEIKNLAPGRYKVSCCLCRRASLDDPHDIQETSQIVTVGDGETIDVDFAL